MRLAVALCLTLGLADLARAGPERDAGSGPPSPEAGQATAVSCWLELRLFRSFTAGVVDFCRGHLTYEPGALDCYQFMDEVCSVFLPASLEWTETRRPVAPPAVLPCPDGPEPPVCRRLMLR